MRNKVILALVASSLFTMPVAEATKEHWEDFIRKGGRGHQAGKYGGPSGQGQAQNWVHRPREIDPEAAQQAGINANRYFQQGELKEKQKKPAEAAVFNEHSLKIRNSIWGDRDPGIYEISKRLAAIYKKQGRDADVVQCYWRMYSIKSKQTGSGAVENMALVQSLSDMTMKLKRYHESVGLLNELLTMQEKKGLPQSATVSTRIKLAVANIHASNFKDAEKALSDALLIEERSATPNKERMLAILDNYSIVFRETDRPNDADTVDAKARELRAAAAPAPTTSTTTPTSSAPPTAASSTATPTSSVFSTTNSN